MIQEALPHLPSGGKGKNPNRKYSPEIESSEDLKKSSTLIEFPGRRNVPEWRKQLSKRVREVQERKAREAAEELAALQEAGLVSCALPSGQLELVPDLENPVVNPIVSKALERLERARRADSSTQRTATAAAPALEHDTDVPAMEAIDALAVEAKTRLKVVAPPQPFVEIVETVAAEFNDLDSIEPIMQTSVQKAAVVADELIVEEMIATVAPVEIAPVEIAPFDIEAEPQLS